MLGDKTILSELDFLIEEGKWIGLLGPNGAGKTTLLRTMGGLLPYSGTLSLMGQEVQSYKPQARARKVALVRQSHALAFDFRVDELVLLGRSPYKSTLSVFEKSDLERVTHALTLVDLEGFEGRLMSSLSGGEQQRVFLAQALVQEADVLLLDEPTTHLDVHHQFEFLTQVQDFISDGKTVVGAFHDLELAARFSDHLFVLQNGRLAASGSPKQILNEALIRDIFQMDAQVTFSESHPVRISYQKPRNANRV